MGYEIAIGIGIFSFLLLYFTSQLEEEHTFLKLITVFFAVGILILIPKIYIEPQCYSVVANETEIGNVTSYEYTSHCFSDHTESGVTFLKATTWFYWCFISYVFLFIFYSIFFKKTQRMLKR